MRKSSQSLARDEQDGQATFPMRKSSQSLARACAGLRGTGLDGTGRDRTGQATFPMRKSSQSLARACAGRDRTDRRDRTGQATFPMRKSSQSLSRPWRRARGAARLARAHALACFRRRVLGMQRMVTLVSSLIRGLGLRRAVQWASTNLESWSLNTCKNCPRCRRRTVFSCGAAWHARTDLSGTARGSP